MCKMCNFRQFALQNIFFNKNICIFGKIVVSLQHK